MCDPITMIAATASAVGSIQQGKAQQAQANAMAGESEYQAGVARSNAQAEAFNIRRAGARQRGDTLSSVVASGVKIGEGSALDAERQVMEDASRDEYMALLTGERQSSAYLREAENQRRAGRDARRAGNIGAFTSLLSAGGSYAKASGWRSNGPGFSGTQMPAPVESRKIPRG